MLAAGEAVFGENNFVLEEFFPAMEAGAALRRGEGAETAGELLTAGMVNYVFDQYDRGPLLQFTILGDPALSVGPREPLLAVTLSGDSIPDGATRFPKADGSPWEVVACFRSDVAANDAGILVLENDEALDPSLYSVATGVDSATNRWEWTVRRERPPETSFRKIEFRVTDVRGRSLSHALRTDAEIALSFDGIAWEESLVVPSAPRLRIDIGADVPLAREIGPGGDAFSRRTLYHPATRPGPRRRTSRLRRRADLASLAGLKRTFQCAGRRSRFSPQRSAARRL
jgi:hypothetical protein